MVTWQGCLERIAILIIGVYFGLVSVMLGMMADSGTTLAVTCASIALLGSLSLVIGGIIGALTKRWIALVPGTILILTALTPSLRPLAAISILLIYCCFIKPRNVANERREEFISDEVPILQLQEYSDKKIITDTTEVPV